MQPQIAAALRALNQQFYARFAGEFAATRRSWPPGYDRILPYLQGRFNVLDVGCGNARLLAFLAERNWRGRYVGLDGSENLLAEARTVAAAHPSVPASFVLADLLGESWTADAQQVGPFDALVTLAVLHHIPGRCQRIEFLRRCAQLLPPGGHVILSTWQFMTSERLKRRLAPWEAAGVRAEDVEEGDYLVGWGEGSPGLRYCAYIDETGLAALAAEAGLKRVESFYSDGHEGNLNLYGVFSVGED